MSLAWYHLLCTVVCWVSEREKTFHFLWYACWLLCEQFCWQTLAIQVFIGVNIISTVLAGSWVFCWDFWKPEQVYSFKPTKCGGSNGLVWLFLPSPGNLTFSSEIKKEEEWELLNIMLIQDFPLIMNQATVWVIFHPMPLDDTLCRGDHKYLKRESFSIPPQEENQSCVPFPPHETSISERDRGNQVA